MFTGIVEETGVVSAIARSAEMARLRVNARVTVEGTVPGGSVAVNGACLTVVELSTEGFAFDVGPETLARTVLGGLRPGDRVNLERPLRLGADLGGHMVLGHVDGVGVIEDVARVESTQRVRVGLPDRSLAPLLVQKGSVAVDGVSLTVASLDIGSFEVMLIPHTLEATTLGGLEVGRCVNIEMDVIGKYVVRYLSLRETA